MRSLIRIALVSLAALALFSWVSTAQIPTFWCAPLWKLELWLIFHHLDEAFIGGVFALGCADVLLVWRGLKTMGVS